MTRIVPALQVFFRFFPKYAAVIALCYAPWLMGLRLLAANGTLTADAADALAGMFSIFFMPLSNGVIVWLNQKHVEGGGASLQNAFSAVFPQWKDLIAAYISVGFIMIGWLAVALLPAGLLMMALDLKSLYWLAPTGVLAVIYVMSRYVFLDFYIVLRGEAGWAARRKCPELTRGRLLQVAVAVTLMAAPLMLAEFGYPYVATEVQMITGVIQEQITVGVLSLTSTLLYCIPQIYFYLLYREIT